MRPTADTTRFAALRATRELAACSEQHLRSLLRYADEVAVPAGRLIAQQGRYCREFVVVVQGALAVGSNGSRRLLNPGDSYGWDSMWERSVNEATVVVESDARLLVMSHDQFRAVKAVAARNNA